MDDVNLRKKIDTTFKLYGFNLRRDAQTFLVDQLRPVASAERQEWLERFTESIQKLSPESAVIEKSLVETAVQECLRSGLDKTETVFNVISSFEVPRFLYDLERKKFMKSSEPSPEIFGPPIDKAAIYRDRYTVLQQRTARHELFTPAVAGGGGGGGGDADAPQKFRLSPVEYLLSCAGRQDDVVVLGMLAQLREGRFFLEDPTGVVQLDLSQAKYHTGLFCENCFVLAEGWYDDRIFHIQGLGFPPAESSKSSRAYFGNVNTFGGPSVVSLKTSSNLLKHEQENQDAMIVFLADVWLDSFKVMDKLRQLFAGYAECPPVAFVLMGSFLSAQGGGGGQARLLRARLRALADLVLQFPELARRSRFVLVPGPVDPACPGILPRPALPAHVAEEFLSRLPSAELATNPCRLQYCTQEIVVARQDLVTKLCRNTVHFPASGEIADHFAKTILCQAHLTPLPLSVCPLYWGFDAALRLYPLPDLVVVGDTFSAFTSSYMGCVVSNPGSFPKSEFSFKVYIPATRQMEDSQLPND
ncbi:DNA polymerase epsilon subunit 2 [Bacillus rossius redtenbacheri]|uniref:DNA polymerase epsilon subunit 2 n=1 Tax=Bacillus rossius redtenbacheri TaxID=93214 RepID=UPI002FDD6A9E